MTPEQKQHAIALVKAWDKTAYGMHADAMAALLQELIEAPESDPVARVTGYYAGYLSIATVDGRVLPAGTALYAAPPAPSVPDVVQTVPSNDQLTQILNGLDRCAAAESKRAFLRVWIRDWTVHKLAAQTSSEAPADVARDAARLDWLDAQCSENNGRHICCLPGGLRVAIDAAMREKGGA